MKSKQIPDAIPASLYLNRHLDPQDWGGRALLQVHPCDVQPQVGDEPPWLSVLYAYANLLEVDWHPTMKELSALAKAGDDERFLWEFFESTPSAHRALRLSRVLLPDHFAPAGPVDAHATSALSAAERVEIGLLRQWLKLDRNRWWGPNLKLMVLLVGKEGVPCQLDLQVVELPVELAEAHGCIVRAPGAALLSLGDDFQAGLSQVQCLLQRVLRPAEPSSAGVVRRAIAWRLRAFHKEDGSGNPVSPYIDELTGPSLTAALAVGSLWLLCDHLADTWKTQWHRVLRELKLARFCATAALAGYDQPAPHLPNPPSDMMDDPLQWRLATVGAVPLKFDALARFIPNWGEPGDTAPSSLRKAFVAEHQDVSGNKVEAVECARLSDLLLAAHEVSDPVRLPPEFEALEQALIDSGSAGKPISQTLLDAVHAAPLPRWLKAGQSPTPDEAEKVLRAWWLKRYAHWASGRYQAFGPLRGGPTDEPVALTEHFHPIDIDPERRMGEELPGENKGLEQSFKNLQVNSLPELFDKCPRDVAFRLHAAPAGGKTTLLAHHEMETAVNALRQYRRTGIWGELALWLPMRDYPTRMAVDSLAAVEALWARVGAKYPDLAAVLLNWRNSGLELPGLRLRWLCDAVNEMPAEGEPQRRQAQDALFRGLTEQGAALGWLPPVFTVRTHSQNPSLAGARGCTLLTWGAPSRNRYMEKRLGAHSEAVKILRAAIDADPRDDREKFFATPGHLAAQCTLMAAGIVSEPAKNRAQLFCTLLWLRLAQELKHGQLPSALLSADERNRIDCLQESLAQKGGWRWPRRMGLLMQALSSLAVYQQHLDPASSSRQRQAAKAGESNWSMSAPRDWLLRSPHQFVPNGLDAEHEEGLILAAQHLNLLRPDIDGERFTWTHQLWLELFSALGLQLEADGGAWIDMPEPVLPSMDALWAAHKATGKPRKEFHIPVAPPLPNAGALWETLRYLIQLRGDIVKLVERVLKAGNAPLAARLALDNWSEFGEPPYPEDPLGPWRKEVAHPVLKHVRQTLHNRMYSEAVHISQRIEAGDLLGQLGGSPLYEICGQALILKEDYWVPIGKSGGTISFEMGDLDGSREEHTENGKLYEVKDLPAFRMAGYLVTNAQFRCFVNSKGHDGYMNPAWWPGDAWTWLEQADGVPLNDRQGDVYGLWRAIEQASKVPWSLRQGHSDSNGQGLAPVISNFWQSQAYARWERVQRQHSGQSLTTVCLPTEAQWEGGARWAAAQATAEASRWRFAHPPGRAPVPETLDVDTPEGNQFADILPWTFNHYMSLDWRTSPVGVFLDSHAPSVGGVLTDLAGNVWEWCSSAFKTPSGARRLGDQVTQPARGDELRTLRGGSYCYSVARCRVGDRSGVAPDKYDDGIGFRLVLADEL